jgi:hypothetical protein
MRALCAGEIRRTESQVAAAACDSLCSTRQGTRPFTMPSVDYYHTSPAINAHKPCLIPRCCIPRRLVPASTPAHRAARQLRDVKRCSSARCPSLLLLQPSRCDTRSDWSVYQSCWPYPAPRPRPALPCPTLPALPCPARTHSSGASRLCRLVPPSHARLVAGARSFLNRHTRDERNAPRMHGDHTSEASSRIMPPPDSDPWPPTNYTIGSALTPAHAHAHAHAHATNHTTVRPPARRPFDARCRVSASHSSCAPGI